MNKRDTLLTAFCNLIYEQDSTNLRSTLRKAILEKLKNQISNEFYLLNQKEGMVTDVNLFCIGIAELFPICVCWNEQEFKGETKIYYTVEIKKDNEKGFQAVPKKDIVYCRSYEYCLENYECVFPKYENHCVYTFENVIGSSNSKIKVTGCFASSTYIYADNKFVGFASLRTNCNEIYFYIEKNKKVNIYIVIAANQEEAEFRIFFEKHVKFSRWLLLH